MSSRAAARAALSLYGPCGRRGRWAQRAAAAGITLFGARALPGRSVPWRPATEAAWAALADAWRRELGGFDEVAGYERLQASRGGGAVLLLRRGVPIAFVKLRQDPPDGLLNEIRAVHAVCRRRPRSFLVPEPLHVGAVAGWHYLASAPLPPGLHRPPRHPPLGDVLAEIEAALGALPSEGIPAHWRPMHGDLAPWNLRELSDGRLVLMDWEEAGWGPPGADRVFYEATSAAVARRRALPCEDREAVAFWRARVQAEQGNARDDRLAAALRDSLDLMGAAAEATRGHGPRRA